MINKHVVSSTQSCDFENIILSTAFHEFEVSNDLQYYLWKVGGLSIFSFLLDRGDEVIVFTANVYEHSYVEVSFDAAACIERGLNKKSSNFVKRCLITVGIFLYLFEFQQLFYYCFVDNAQDTHNFDVLKPFLQCVLCLLW